MITKENNCNKKVGEEMKADEKLVKEIEEFEDAFAVPRNPNQARVKVRAL
ncbi:hypothetical protein [Bacillus massilinigeriensis]|nr:hypothetical protein [Bacillus massilionigeriensis]